MAAQAARAEVQSARMTVDGLAAERKELQMQHMIVSTNELQTCEGVSSLRLICVHRRRRIWSSSLLSRCVQ